MTAGAHIVVGWALWTLALSPHSPPLVQPLMVALLSPERPQPEPERPRPRPRLQPTPVLQQVLMPVPLPVPLPELLPIASPTPTPAAPPPAVAAVVEPVAPVVAPPPRPSAPPPPKLLRADQVRYLVMPPAEVPLLSKRAGESGVVWLRVRIDTQGRPSRIGLHRSSGFKRLDEQALAAMSQARFAPQLEDGVAIEVEVIAPIEYPAD